MANGMIEDTFHPSHQHLKTFDHSNHLGKKKKVYFFYFVCIIVQKDFFEIQKMIKGELTTFKI